MKTTWKFLFTIILFLAIPLIPFLLLEGLEGNIEDWLRNQTNKPVVASAVVILLTVDVLLPVPSSVVCTIAGSSLGPVLGTFFSMLGMSLGALAGFGLGKIFGQWAVRHWVSEEETLQLNALVERYGTSILFLLRPIPLFAEGSLLFLGSSSMSWFHFFGATLPIHFALALLYALLGHSISIVSATLLSVVIAVALSVFALFFIRKTMNDQPVQ